MVLCLAFSNWYSENCHCISEKHGSLIQSYYKMVEILISFKGILEIKGFYFIGLTKH